MRFARSFVLLCLNVTFAFSIVGQVVPESLSTTTQRDEQAIAVLQKSFAAMGGSAWSLIHSTRESVQITRTNDGSASTSTVVLTTGGRGYMRIDSHDSTGNAAVTTDGLTAQSLNSDGKVESFPRFAFGNGGFTHIPALSSISMWADPNALVNYLGLEDLGRSKVHHISLQIPLDPTLGLGDYDFPLHVFVDSETLLVSKFTYAFRSLSNLKTSQAISVTYGDYRLVSGVVLPFAVTYSIRDQVLSSQIVTSVEFNVPVVDAAFRMAETQ